MTIMKNNVNSFGKSKFTLMILTILILLGVSFTLCAFDHERECCDCDKGKEIMCINCGYPNIKHYHDNGKTECFCVECEVEWTN